MQDTLPRAVSGAIWSDRLSGTAAHACGPPPPPQSKPARADPTAPPGGRNGVGITWHMPRVTFVPPGSIHNTGSHWHCGGQTCIPPGTRHVSGVSWHKTDTSFIPR